MAPLGEELWRHVDYGAMWIMALCGNYGAMWKGFWFHVQGLLEKAIP